MPNNRFRGLLRVPPVGCVLLAWAITLPGCGEEKSGTVVPQDAAATAERNKSMEDYMKSPAGKSASKPK